MIGIRKRFQLPLPGRPPLELGGRTLVMGILNLTDDSFSNDGLSRDPARAVDGVREMEDAGADLIDIGAESTRPSAVPVGRSLSEWTATSTRPSSNASRSAVTNTPVPPRAASGSALRSPSVVTSTSSTSRPERSRNRPATRRDCVVASSDARVPMRTAFTASAPRDG